MSDLSGFMVLKYSNEFKTTVVRQYGYVALTQKLPTKKF